MKIRPKKETMDSEDISAMIAKEEHVLLFYHAEWSGPSTFAKDIVGMDEIPTKYIDIDVDNSANWVKDHPGIPGIPYFELYIKGKRVSSLLGITSVSDLRGFIEEGLVRYEGCESFGE